jgi:hypothetical protein
MVLLAGRDLSRRETEAAMLAADHLPSESRALVPVAPSTEPARAPRAIARDAAFLTHLIATARQVPQTRDRRRAEPGEVIAAYEAVVARVQAQ